MLLKELLLARHDIYRKRPLVDNLYAILAEFELDIDVMVEYNVFNLQEQLKRLAQANLFSINLEEKALNESFVEGDFEDNASWSEDFCNIVANLP